MYISNFKFIHILCKEIKKPACGNNNTLLNLAKNETLQYTKNYQCH